MKSQRTKDNDSVPLAASLGGMGVARLHVHHHGLPNQRMAEVSTARMEEV